MYQVFKDAMTFYVNDEEKAKRYAEDGYDVFQVDKLRVNDQGKFEIENNDVDVIGMGKSEELPAPEAVSIGE